ncbi:TetR/AcrR family transcriptional regulator [Rhodococcus kronopolitis]|uniref:TetR/AcrR family transcriptional regulator n=1 Tax=Rhodococcus kronopolitis TaxID=1460226 RepID=A0ABV9FWF7_9NOCA
MKPASSVVRDRILDAAELCLARDGIRRTTVRAVAKEADLSRAYLYRFFTDKATLLSAALIRRGADFWEDAADRIARQDSVSGMLAEAVVLSRQNPLGPLAVELAAREPHEYAEIMSTYSQDVVAQLSDFWADRLCDAQRRGLAREDLDLPGAAEWLVRMLVSLVGTPGSAVDVDDREALSAYLQTFLGPAFSPVSGGTPTATPSPQG